jgi:hypothetical protein
MFVIKKEPEVDYKVEMKVTSVKVPLRAHRLDPADPCGVTASSAPAPPTSPAIQTRLSSNLSARPCWRRP